MTIVFGGGGGAGHIGYEIECLLKMGKNRCNE